MIKTISKAGNSHDIIFEAALMKLAHLKTGDQLNLEVHQDETTTLTPLHPVIET